MHPDIELARILATKYHAGQKYGNEPYTTHLKQVATSVAGGSRDERKEIVAWLHDVLEDTPCTEHTLNLLFEDNVVAAVVAMTRQKDETKDAYLLRCKANAIGRFVKIHDSFCNLKTSLMRFDAKRIKKYTEQINFLVSE